MPDAKPNQSRKPDDGWKEPLWERQEGEGVKAFNAFAKYRDLGPARSGPQVAGELAKSGSLINRWQGEWGWVERATAWDDYADRNDRERDAEERARARRKMIEAHAKGGSKLHALGLKVLAKYDEDGEAGELAKRRIEDLSAADAARLMDIGAKMERLARGETTERLEVREAMVFVERLVDLCLGYLNPDHHEAFLSDVDQTLGVGGFGNG